MKLEKKTYIAISVFAFVCTTILALLYLRANYQYFPNMHYSYALDSQKQGKLNREIANRELPPNSIPAEMHDKEFGKIPYKASTSLEDLANAKTLSSPITSKQELAKALKLGKQKYNIYCAPCHGIDGGVVKANGLNRGSGSVVKYWPVIPSLYGQGRYLPELSREDYPVGAMYHIITVGVGSMRNYSSQLNDYERWAVSHYVKFLQQSNSAKNQKEK